LIFEKQFVEGSLYKYPMKNIFKDGKVLAHLGFKSKVFSEPLTDLRAWVGFCNSSPQQVSNINIDISSVKDLGNTFNLAKTGQELCHP
jgi:hypothetical protein